MAAPGLSLFGDGSHPPGATGLAVQGGGFGAFPGSVWIYQNADRTGSADELTVTAWNGVEATVDIPGSLTNTAGTRYLFLQRSDLAWSNALAFTLEAAGGVELVVQDATHAHAADSPALVQAHQLAVQDAAHGHAADNVTLTTGTSLAVADAAHGHSVDNVVLTQAHVLAVADARHLHAADGVALTQAHQLAVADASHGHAAESPTLDVGGFALTVADALHGHAADGLVLTQAGTLTVADARHLHAADLVSLRLPGTVPPSTRVFVVAPPSRVAIVQSSERRYAA